MKDFFYLENDVIRVKILFPESEKYKRTRFNHSGFIADVWYKNVKFSEYERSQPGFPTTEGSGLCCAYEPIVMESKPETGQRMLIPGAGVGIAGDRTEIYEPLKTDFWFDGKRAEFETQSPVVDGYSYYEKREIFFEGEELVEKVTFTNTGEKRIVTSEYGHNFLSLGGQDVSPDYRMQVFCMEPPEGFTDNEMIWKDGAFTFTDYPNRSYFYKTFETKASENGYAWILESKSTGISCYEKIDFVPERIQVWGDYYLMCGEFFAPIDLEAGESISWTRRWGFRV